MVRTPGDDPVLPAYKTGEETVPPHCGLEGEVGLDPTTSDFKGRRSAIELFPHDAVGAGRRLPSLQPQSF